jgi:hypothetical protein
MSLILHCGGVPATYDQLCAIPTPPRTSTYSPVPYKSLVDLARTEIRSIGLEVDKEAFGINREGGQFFGVITTRGTGELHNPSLGLRSSHDKSLSNQCAIGDWLTVCDNMAFTTNGTVVQRQHRGDAFHDFGRLVRNQLRSALDIHHELTMDFDAFRNVDISQDRGFELIGRALGHEILKPTQANIAMRDWRTPRHNVDSFKERTLYALYQCFTEGLKKGPAGTVIERHAGAHDFFLAQTPRVVIEA